MADEVAGDFADGVAFVTLAATTDAALVAPAIAQALGVREEGDEQLLDRLVNLVGCKRLLLFLDNFEQVVGAAPLVTDLLVACPRLMVLVTSRVQLRLSGEHEYAVPPRRMTDDDGHGSLNDVLEAEAIRLFVERAQAVNASFTLTEDNASTVAAICHRLDGLPLAIELAVARIKVLPPPAMLARLERRLPLLTGGRRDAPARQRTMRDTIAWSHDLLSPAEQRLFRRLAVFAGGCSLQAAEAVAATPSDPDCDVFEGIASLVDQSLLFQKDGPTAGPRFFMLETVRQDALERLALSGEEEDVRAWHAVHFLALSETRGRVVPQREWLEQIELEHDNLRAVLGWAIGRGDADTAQRLVVAVWRYFWFVRGYFREGRMWTERVRELGPGTAPGMYAEVLFAASGFAGYSGDIERAVTLAQDALTRARADRFDLRTGIALHHLAMAIGSRDGVDKAEPLHEEARALLKDARSVDERRTAAAATHNLAVAVAWRGDLDRAAALAAEGLARWRDLERLS